MCVRGSHLTFMRGRLGLSFCPRALVGPFPRALVWLLPWALVGPFPRDLVSPFLGPLWALGFLRALPFGPCGPFP